MNFFQFNGKQSSNFGLRVTGKGTFDAPARDLEAFAIPGRNGLLHRDNGRYENIPVPYSVSVAEDFPRYAEGIRAWLCGSSGYCRLEDSYDPRTFRMGMYSGGLTFDVHALNRSAEATVTFDCMPQRFLKAGEYPITFSAEENFHNPTDFPAQPLITVYGSAAGTVTVGTATVQIKAISDPIILDCQRQQAYSQPGDGAPVNQNSSIYAPEFPVLAPGVCPVAFTGGITKLEIIPRWWTL